MHTPPEQDKLVARLEFWAEALMKGQGFGQMIERWQVAASEAVKAVWGEEGEAPVIQGPQDVLALMQQITSMAEEVPTQGRGGEWALLRDRFREVLLKALVQPSAFEFRKATLEQMPQWTWQGNPLRLPQVEAAYALRDLSQSKGPKATRAIAPMGSGKTIMAALWIASTKGKVLYVSESRRGKGNAKQDIQAFFVENEINKAKESWEVMTYSAWNELTRKHLSTYELIIFDEADVNMLSNLKGAKIAEITETGITLIAVSATEEQGSGRQLAQLFPISLLDIPLPKSLYEMYKQGYLCNMIFETLVIEELMVVEAKTVYRKTKDGNNFVSERAVNTWLKTGKILDEVLENFLSRFKGQRGVMVFPDNTYLSEVIQKGKMKGLKIVQMTGEETEDRLKAVQGMLENREVDIVVGSRMVGRGIDFQAEVVYNLTMTRSPQVFWQALGRGMRVDPHDPKKEAHLITVQPRRIYSHERKRDLRVDERPLCPVHFFDSEWHSKGEKASTQADPPFNAHIVDLKNNPPCFSTVEVMRWMKKYRLEPIDFRRFASVWAEAVHSMETEEAVLIRAVLTEAHPKRQKMIDTSPAHLSPQKYDLKLSYPEEEALLVQAKSGDLEAQGKLIKVYDGFLRALAEAMAERPEDVDDLVQEARIVLLLNLIRKYDVEQKDKPRFLVFALGDIFKAMKRTALDISIDLHPQPFSNGTCRRNRRGEARLLEAAANLFSTRDEVRADVLAAASQQYPEYQMSANAVKELRMDRSLIPAGLNWNEVVDETEFDDGDFERRVRRICGVLKCELNPQQKESFKLLIELILEGCPYKFLVPFMKEDLGIKGKLIRARLRGIGEAFKRKEEERRNRQNPETNWDKEEADDRQPLSPEVRRALEIECVLREIRIEGNGDHPNRFQLQKLEEKLATLRNLQFADSF